MQDNAKTVQTNVRDAVPAADRTRGIVPRPRTEPIAILGIGCRIPGGVADPAALWELLRSGVDAVTEVPESRWSLGRWYDPEPQAGKTYARWGGFIDDVDRFDAAFFGVSPREAAAIDPQQRLLLQTAYEALEDGGQTPESLSGRRTGVYVGMWGSDYEDFLFSDPAHIDFYRTQGTGRYTAAGRLSFVLGLEGPSLSVDTACSSSLVTVHLACQAIRNGECEVAIAGGVNLLLQPQITIAYSQSRMMATDGRCRFGDAHGTGYVRSEGVGLIVLKPLSAALADGDPIYAVIRGSAVNNDGKSSGSFGTPGIRGQEAMLRQAYRTAGVDPREVRFIEAHGTGTKRGDPVEVRALANVLCENRPADRPLLIGSVKTNIGHMEAAAGIGGLLKATLALQHRAVPASLHFNQPNPNIPFQLLPIQIPTELRELPADGQVHYAGVNSFGISGTNAHIVLSEAPGPEAAGQRQPALDEGRYVLNLSARNPGALRGLAEKYIQFLSEGPGIQTPLADICYTLSVRRSLHEHRLSVSGRTREELLERLRAFLDENEMPGLVSGQVAIKYERPPVRTAAFVYSGQGSQWINMGRDLLESETVFRVIIEECDREIRALTGWSLIEELGRPAGESSRLDDIDVMWPAIFAIQVATTEYLKSLGVRPSAVVGHSIGEAAAAWASGAMSLEDAVRVIVTQGKLVHETSGRGGMALVGLSFEKAEAELSELGLAGDGQSGLIVAIESSPEASVVSGEPAALDTLVAKLEERGIFARRVNTPAAVHSAQMDALKDRLLANLAGLKTQRATIPFYSATYGTAYDTSALSPEYFYENLRRPVLFASAIDAIFYDGPTVFLEISPHPIVTVSVQETIRGHQSAGFAISSLRKGESGLQRLGAAISALSEAGVQLDLERARRESAIPALRLHTGKPRLAFVFSGQGPQWWAMGRELLEREPVFRAKVEEIDRLLSQQADWSLLAELTVENEEQSRLGETRFAQPAIFALQVGLAELWRSWGVEPDAITGHSVGEVAAAHVSGKLSLADAVNVIYHRGRLMQDATGLGKMAAIEAPLERAREFIQGYEDRVAIGAANSPTSTVLSGETAALEEILKKVEAAGIYQKMLPVNYAFHSPQMESFKTQMNGAMGELKASPARVPIVSTVTGELADAEAYGAKYWGENIRQGVLFANAIDTLIENGFELFLEIGPHPVLSAYVLQCLEHAEVKGHAFPSLRRNQPEQLTLLGNLGALFTTGYPINWRRMYSAVDANASATTDASAGSPSLVERGQCVQLPTYAWQLERFWIDAPKAGAGRETASARGNQDTHPLLQRRLDTAQPIFEAEIGDDASLFQPAFQSTRLLAPMLLLESAMIASVAEQRGARRFDRALSNVQFRSPVSLESNGRIDLQHVFDPDQSGQVRVYDRPIAADGIEGAEKWTCNFSCEVDVSRASAAPANLDLAAARAQLQREMSPEQFYAQLEEQGVTVDADKRCLSEIRIGDGEALLQIEWNDELLAAAGGFRIPPVVLEVLSNTWNLLGKIPSGEILLPDTCEHFQLVDEDAAPAVYLHVKLEPNFGDSEKRPCDAGVRIYSEHGQCILLADGLGLRRYDQTALLSATRRGFRGWLYEHQWEKVELPVAKAAPTSDAGTTLIFADARGFGSELAARMLEQGQAARLVVPGSQYQFSETKIIVPAHDPAAFERLVADMSRADDLVFGNVVYLWGADGSAAGMSGGLQFDDSGDRLRTITGGLLHLTQALIHGFTGDLPQLTIVTHGARSVRAVSGQPDPIQATLWGLGTSIETEHPELHCRKVDLDPEAGTEQAGLLLGEVRASDQDLRVAYRGGKRFVERLVPMAPTPGGSDVADHGESSDHEPQAVALDSTGRGTFENLILRPMDRRLPGPNDVEIRVRATGLNFRDVLAALNEYPDGPVPFGIECAGEITGIGENVTDLAVGDEVIALSIEPAFATYVTVPADLVIQKPGHLSFREAATIPVVFLTAFYALHRFGRIAPGDRVLIHSAAGGVGLASLQLARSMGAEIYATVSTEEKRNLLRSLGVRNIYNSRSLDFADEILADTNGEGVDIVLNSLAGEFVGKGLSLLRENGRFIEIGKKDLLSAKDVARIKKRVSYFIVDLMEVARHQPDLIQSMLLHLAEEFSGGDLQPLPYTAYEFQEVQSAFFEMARGRHIGKLIVEHTAASATVRASYNGIRPDATYLITGGLGGLGLLFARHLAEQGAAHLVLTGRSAPGEIARKEIAAIESSAAGSVQIHVMQGDVALEDDVKRIFTDIDQKLPPLAGILHTAGIVRDGLLQNLSWEQFESVFESKIAGSYFLHKHSQNRKLDFFVMFSSIVATVGSAAQANYASANAYMDALAHYRRSRGLAALSVNWGPWAGAGMAAELAERGASNWSGRGISFLPADIGVAALDQLLYSGKPQAGVYRIDWDVFGEQFPQDRPAPGFFARVLTERKPGQQEEVAASGVGMLRELTEAPPPARRRMLVDHVRGQISKILGLSSAQAVDVSKGFKEMGLDSLMTVELRNRLQKNLQCALPSTLAFDYPNVEVLSVFLHDQALNFDAAGPEAVAEIPAQPTAKPVKQPSASQPATAAGSSEKVEVAAIMDRLEQISEKDVLAELLGS